jgi:DNA-binding NarL/FixJ family response regulator
VIRVLIVDDHPLVRAGLGALISSTADITVVAEAARGDDAIGLAVEHAPDVILMDLSMPGMGGAEATRLLGDAAPGSAVVVLTSFHDPARVGEVLRAGAVGFLLKDGEPADVLAAVRAAAAGHAPIDPRVARALLPVRRPRDPAAQTAGGRPPLSVREEQVLALIGEGLSNRQIGSRLGIAERTVKVHVGNVFRRIEVADRTSAAMWARDNPVSGDGGHRHPEGY